MLALPSGDMLDLDHLPGSATLEMLQACRDHILLSEAQLRSTAPSTPAKSRAPQRAPTSGAKAAGESKSSGAKALTAAQILKEKKSIVKDIKKRITPLMFHPGWDSVGREVKFAADRLPAEAAEQILGASQDTWSSPTISATLAENDALGALGLEPGELKGTVWAKGGLIGGRFGAVKSRRLGTASLVVRSLKLSYTVKSQRLTGTLLCINGGEVSGNKRGHRGDIDDLSDVGYDLEEM